MILYKYAVQNHLGRIVCDDTDIVKLRNDIELQTQKEVKNKYLHDTLSKDECFNRFSKFLQNDEKCKNQNHRKSVIERFGIWNKTKSIEPNKENELNMEKIQERCFNEGYRAVQVSNGSDSLIPAVHHQLQYNESHKNKTPEDLKEIIWAGIENNQEPLHLDLKTGNC